MRARPALYVYIFSEGVGEGKLRERCNLYPVVRCICARATTSTTRVCQFHFCGDYEFHLIAVSLTSEAGRVFNLIYAFSGEGVVAGFEGLSAVCVYIRFVCVVNM